MARIVEEKKKEHKKDPVTHTLFLSSIKSWYNKEGIKCGVEKVSKIFQKKGEKPQVAINLSILDDMPKCRARVIKEDGTVEMEEDERTGKEVAKIELIDDAQEVTFFLKLSEVEEVKEEGIIPEMEEPEYMIHHMASGFPLINAGFIASGELPKGNEKSFAFTHEELVNCLKGLEFTAFVEEREFQGKYNVLIPVVPGLDEAERVVDE